MTVTALVAGVGEVGTRAARQLVDTAGVTRVLLTDADAERTRRVVAALGAKAEVTEYRPGDALPSGIDVVACALPTGEDHAVVTAAMEARVPIATSDDDHDAIDAVRALDRNARGAGVTMVVGCGLAPGLADVLVAHAASTFERVDEIRVARTGWAGPASVAAVRHARRATARAWHDGGWREEHPHGETLVWFPDPIGGRDCHLVTGGSALLVDAFPQVQRVSVLLGEPPRRTWLRRRFGDEGEWGATRVEVWGRRDGTHDCVVYGVVERTAIAAGGVLAVVAARLGGAIGPRLEKPGVHGPAAAVEPTPFLAELAQRGVRAAVFEGATVA